MNKSIAIILSFILLSINGFSQKDIPQLIAEIRNGKDDTTKVRNFVLLSEKYRHINIDSCLLLSGQAAALARTLRSVKAIAISQNALGYAHYLKGNLENALKAFISYDSASKEMNDNSGRGHAINNQGNVYIELGNYKEALDKYKLSLELRSTTKNTADIAASYNNIGYVYKEIGDYDKAVENILNALKLFEKIGNENGISYCYTFLGTIYERKKEFEKAITYHRQTLPLHQKLKNISGIAISFQLIGSLNAELNRYDSAAYYYQKALEIYKSIGDKRQEATVLHDIGYSYYLQKNNAKALPLFEQALSINKTINNKRGLSSNYLSLGDIYLEMHKPGITKAYLDSALAIAKETNKRQDLKNVYEGLSKYYEATGQYDKSLENYKLAIQFKDSLFNESNSRSIADMQTRYETEKKEQQIQIQQLQIAKKNYWIVGISGLMLLAALLGYSYYRRYKLKQQARLNAEILKQQELATKAVLEAEEKERQRIAKDLHDGIGQMMSAAKMNLSTFESAIAFTNTDQRTSFDKAVGLIDESCREIRVVSHNMMPNALLKNSLASAIREFIEKLDQKKLQVHLYTEGLDERLDSNTETVLYRVVQECVNNVIKHSGASTLDISVVKDKDSINATIEDNGKGFDTGDKEKFEGIGLKNIITRVEYLKGTVDFDSAPGRGTLVAIHIPIS